jgi:cytochrome c553
MLKRTFLIAVALGFVCAPLFAGSAKAEDKIAAQKTLWDKDCKKCHATDGSGKNAKGEWLPVAKTLKLEKPELLSAVSAEAKKLTDEAILKSMVDGKGKMKAMKDKLSEADMKALVEYTRYLQSQAK